MASQTWPSSCTLPSPSIDNSLEEFGQRVKWKNEGVIEGGQGVHECVVCILRWEILEHIFCCGKGSCGEREADGSPQKELNCSNKLLNRQEGVGLRVHRYLNRFCSVTCSCFEWHEYPCSQWNQYGESVPVYGAHWWDHLIRWRPGGELSEKGVGWSTSFTNFVRFGV